MNELQYRTLREIPEKKDAAAQWFHEKWGIPEEAYLDSMHAALAGPGPVPEWYLALEGARIIGGMGVGLASAICPMYIGEVSPSNRRGMMVSWNQFAIIFGQLVVYFVNFLILGKHTVPVIEQIGQGLNAVAQGSDPWTISTGWRYMFGSEAIPAAIFTVLVCFVPESPRYLVMAGKDDKALSVLSRINGLEQAKVILADIRSTIKVKTEKLFTYGWLVVFIGIMLSVFQQVVGMSPPSEKRFKRSMFTKSSRA